VSAAQSDELVVGFSDHSLVAGFADSEIIERELHRDINYRIILGALERVRGEVIPENSERLRGDVTKITYEVSQEFTGDDVYAFYQEQLTAKNYEVLYSCGGRECGSSNYWANDIFRNRILYGPERNQHFIFSFLLFLVYVLDLFSMFCLLVFIHFSSLFCIIILYPVLEA